ncbi:DUF3857 domain-containing protein [Paucihalobacter sp.]|uniref:DUF3857 domain-containing protein n=1 Tax=Paucihalobacter sp. TaxID=2850405 RepID=UPI002FDFB629
MKYILAVSFLILKMTVFSQNTFNSNSLLVSIADLKINTYDKDSLANALVLYEYGKSYVDKESFRLKTEIKVKLKILTKEGLNRANIQIPLYVDGNKEEISNINGATYNLVNGNIENTPLLNNQIFTEKYNERYNITKILLPNVKQGSVIVYSYLKTSPYITKYYPWSFQENIPKLYSEYNTSIPGNYDYHIKLVGSLKLESHEQDLEYRCLETGRGASADCATSRFIMRDIPAFISEDYMTTVDNYRSRIEYELKTMRDFTGGVKNFAKTWDTADKEFRSSPNLGGQLKAASSYVKMLPESISNITSPIEKAEQILIYIQDNYTWNNKNRNYEESMKNLISEKSGTATEINMLLHNILISNDLEAYPVLTSTRDNGFPTKIHPVITDFNYLIVLLKINGKSYLLDATDPFLAFGQLPFKCLNQYGRALDFKHGSYWIDIEPSKTTTTQYKAELEFVDEKTMVGKLNTTSTGYNALSVKKSYYNNPTQYVENLDNKLDNFNFKNHHVIDSDKNSFMFKEDVEIEWELDAIGDKIYLNPIFFKFISSNPFKLQNRSYPIDFGYKSAFLFNIRLNLNDLYQVEELPKDKNISLPDGKGSLIFKLDATEEQISIYYKFNFSDALYPSEYYPYLKEYMSEILNISDNSFILLRKK